MRGFKNPSSREMVYCIGMCGTHQGREMRGMVWVLLSKSRKKLGSWSRSVQVSTFRRFPMVGSLRNLGNRHTTELHYIHHLHTIHLVPKTKH